MALVENMSGKVCEHSNVYFRTNRRTGAVTSGKLCNPYQGEPTENQVAVRNKFKTAQAAAKAILHASSSDSDQANYTKLQTYKAQYDANPKFGGSLYNWIVKKEFALLSAED